MVLRESLFSLAETRGDPGLREIGRAMIRGNRDSSRSGILFPEENPVGVRPAAFLRLVAGDYFFRKTSFMPVCSGWVEGCC